MIGKHQKTLYAIFADPVRSKLEKPNEKPRRAILAKVVAALGIALAELDV